MALDINKQQNYIEGFTASSSFLTRFKQKFRICSRQTTKFVSKINHDRSDIIKKEAEVFVESIRVEMQTRPLNTICNSDQSGFLKELHSKRFVYSIFAVSCSPILLIKSLLPGVSRRLATRPSSVQFKAMLP